VIEFLMLKLRNKIASKEFEISLANKELQSAGGWLYAHDLSVNEINAAIDFLIKQIEEIEGSEKAIFTLHVFERLHRAANPSRGDCQFRQRFCCVPKRRGSNPKPTG
jgi:hypothetical protein